MGFRLEPPPYNGVKFRGTSTYTGKPLIGRHVKNARSRLCRPKSKSTRSVATPTWKTEARELDQLCINTIRTLAMDAVQQAKSGHPGTPMALAPLVYTIWQNFLRFDPEDPIWPNRDRFVLSNGHASMLLYAVLYLTRRQGG